MKTLSDCARIFGESDTNTTQLIHRKVFDLSLHTPQKSGAINEKILFLISFLFYQAS